MQETDDHILVPQAESFGTIAVIRSLGQHGYKVHATASDKQALGCQSNFSYMNHYSPGYEDPAYYSWLQELIANHKIKAIIPSEGFLLSIKDHFTEFAHLLPINSDADIVYGCLSKRYVFNAFLHSTDKRLKQHIPNTLIVEHEDPIDWQLLNAWQ
jgi:hypothetical protein